MEHGRERVLCILRRFERVSYSRWSAFNPEKALPQERRFDLLDANEKKTGELCYTSFKAGNESFVDAPWGQTKTLVKNRLKGIEIIEIQGRPVAEVHFSPLKNDVIFTFANGTVMKFDARIIRSDMEYSGETGAVEVREERGRLESERPVSPKLGKDELKNMAKYDRPRSYGNDSYRQWRVLCSGIIPVNEKDVMVALAIYMSELELCAEIWEALAQSVP
jgi:hypothetical protein